MRDLALTLHAQRAHAEAARLLEDTLNRQRRILGPERRDTKRTAHSLAATYSAMGKKSQAQKLQKLLAETTTKPKRRFRRKSR
ncbi:tetratricopeptide repeat protein [Streptomyces bullii]|uniref:Tetratricopeptide repeat protein n=1 Tax=Streptomyces bullii TaxID=349910 RepID=A0ABW0UQF5_9ACTN